MTILHRFDGNQLDSIEVSCIFLIHSNVILFFFFLVKMNMDQQNVSH